jgi:hypothetical protein
LTIRTNLKLNNEYDWKKLMTIKKITSLTMLLTFVLIILTAIILYIVPPGRVAYWADWHLWGMTKSQWGELHINLGGLMLIAGLLHIYYNWKPIIAYMKNKVKKIKVFTPSFNVALLLTLFVILGTYFQIPPMSSIISLSESIKDKSTIKYGEPPYGHAELSSLKLFSKKQGLDLDKSIELLKNAGMEFTNSGETIAVIAEKNKKSPQELYEIIKPALKKNKTITKNNFPNSPPPGFGNKTLAVVCSEYNLVVPTILSGLKGKNIKAKANMIIKEIAKTNGMEPMSIFESLHDLITKQ